MVASLAFGAGEFSCARLASAGSGVSRAARRSETERVAPPEDSLVSEALLRETVSAGLLCDVEVDAELELEDGFSVLRLLLGADDCLAEFEDLGFDDGLGFGGLVAFFALGFGVFGFETVLEPIVEPPKLTTIILRGQLIEFRNSSRM